MCKKLFIKSGILFMLGLWLVTGCSAAKGGKYTREDLDNLAEIRIYSAGSGELLTIVYDEEQLYQFNHQALLDDADTMERQGELEKKLEEAAEQYCLISYKYPVARFGKNEPEENITVTLYENTNIIKVTMAEESIKGLSVPEEFLTFYDEISDEDMNFYRSLLDVN